MAYWIKLETSTPDKLEVAQIARFCKCSHGDAFEALCRFFIWLDDHTNDGRLHFFVPADADAITRLAGFGHALEAVGWITFSGEWAHVTKSP